MGPFLLATGETYEVVIDDRFKPGTHKYVCTPHELMGMVGTITVESPTH
jgi:plastocyanin